MCACFDYDAPGRSSGGSGWQGDQDFWDHPGPSRRRCRYLLQAGQSAVVLQLAWGMLARLFLMCTSSVLVWSQDCDGNAYCGACDSILSCIFWHVSQLQLQQCLGTQHATQCNVLPLPSWLCTCAVSTCVTCSIHVDLPHSQRASTVL